MLQSKATIPFEKLTQELSVESFDTDAARLLRRLDSQDATVEFHFERRSPAGGTHQPKNLLSYYRHEVQRIPVMGREEELHFCMGVEFLWRRLKKARRAAGFRLEDVEVYPGTEDQGCLTCPEGRELVCTGCAPADLAPELRARLRARHSEFVQARNELIERNLHIVFRLMERYRGVNVALEDLIQEANFSLFKAVQGFDFTRGVRFKTYAGYWVNQAFLNAIYNQSRTVRVPAYIQKAMKKIHDASNSVAEGLRDREGLSKKAGIPIELVETAMTGNRFTLSLDKTVDQESGARMLDLIEPEQGNVEESSNAEESVRLTNHLQDALGRLSQREQSILEMRFGLNGEDTHTLSSVGRKLNISLERVRQIQKGALEKIRRGSKAKLLEQFA